MQGDERDVPCRGLGPWALVAGSSTTVSSRLSMSTAVAPSKNSRPVQGLRCLPRAVAGTSVGTAVPRPRGAISGQVGGEGQLGEHVLGNCRQSQLRFPKPLQSELAASSSAASRPLSPASRTPSSAKLCAHYHPTHLLGSAPPLAGASRRSRAGGALPKVQALLRAGSFRLPKSSACELNTDRTLVLTHFDLSWTKIR